MWQVAMSVPAQAEEIAAGILEGCFGRRAAIFSDARTGVGTVSVYLPTLRGSSSRLRQQLKKRLQQSGGGLASQRPRIGIRQIRGQSWKHWWKRHFKPLQISRRLLIRPAWSRRRALAGQRVVVLEPGLSFGTGQHPTTAFCLRQLAAVRRKGCRQSFLDLGCGSGILAMAAAKLGYCPALGLDHDRQAVGVSRRNARRNKLQDRVRFQQQDLRRLALASKKKWDVICANLTDDLLAGNAERICARLEPGGQLVLAGILRHQFAKVRKAYEQLGLRLEACEKSGEWESGRFVFAGCGSILAC
jgi:ribosomal protein L11 methyltransferase